MHLVETIEALREWRQTARRADRRVALVPTMGALHAGHLSLVQVAAEQADEVVVSIFVNPTQFGPQEDFQRYPRNREADLQHCREAGVTCCFLPATETVYAPDHSIIVDDTQVATILEGESRPGHFRGVLTVVAKLFNMVQPDVAVFGQKDAQQLWLIHRMVRDLNLPIELVDAPTMREPDGLAMSSRNAYLSPAHRQQAAGIYRALQAGATACAAGERNAYRLRALMLDQILALPDAEMDYLEIVDQEQFVPLTTILRPALALAAIRFGATRLIDNLALIPPDA
jgi:pantoate--beta-alanine ligase